MTMRDSTESSLAAFATLANDGTPTAPAAVLRSEQEILAAWKSADREPLVSVICHTYNHERFIEDALRGFLIQETDFPFEVIVHDDASEDGTAAIVRYWAEAYPTIIRPVLQEVNQRSRGRKAITITMPMARGRYIAFCEGDDYWTDPQKLRMQVDFLDRHASHVACFHAIDTMTSDGEIKMGARGPNRSLRDLSAKELQYGTIIAPATILFRNIIGELPQEYQHVHNGDTFLFSLLGSGGSAKYLPKIGAAVYRVHPGGIWSMMPQTERNIKYINTLYWMSVYYERCGNFHLAAYFASQAAERLSSRIDTGPSRFVLGLRIMLPLLAKLYKGARRRMWRLGVTAR